MLHISNGRYTLPSIRFCALASHGGIPAQTTKGAKDAVVGLDHRLQTPYNLGNFLRTLAGADQGLVADDLEGQADQDRREGRQPRPLCIFQMGEVAIPRQMFQEILRLIAELRPQPPPAPA